MFHLQSSLIYQALKLEKNPFFRFAPFLRNLFFFIAFLLILYFFVLIFKEEGQKKIELFLAGGLISLGFGILFLELSFFFESKIKRPIIKPSLPEAIISYPDVNLAFYLDFSVTKILDNLLKKAKKRKFKNFPLVELLLYFLCDSKLPEMNFIFSRSGLLPVVIKKELEEKFIQKEKEKKKEQKREFEKDLDPLIFQASQIALQKRKEKIGIGDLLISLLEFSSFFEEKLVLANLRKEDIKNLVDWYERIEKRISQAKKFWNYENLLKKGSIAKDWAAGYSIVLDRYTLDLREIIEKGGFEEVVGHQEEITQVKRILEKEEINNVLLVGEPGTGRKSIVKAIAQEAFLGKASPKINYKRVLDFDIGQMVTETTSIEEFEVILEKCFEECVRAGNIILVIEDIHNFLRQTTAPGAIDISSIISRYLPFPAFQLIGLTTYLGLHTVIEKNPALLNLFEKVEVSEISEKETLELLENFVSFFERKYKKFISYKALREILRLSNRYFSDIPFPEKAIRLLDECLSWLSVSKKGNVLITEHIQYVVSEKIKIPLLDLERKEKEVLLNLEELLHQRIINQEEAVKYVSQALRRARVGIELKSGPIGNFLFLGPTGVGKTETAKALAALYFGSERRMIRLDMSEFQEIEDIKKLIGGNEREGFLTTPVREKPFSLLLLDEIEKAHPNILNLFLQILDEGWVTDGWGRKVNFKNIIIIATSNAGAEVIRQDIAKNKKMNLIKEDLLDYLFREKIFRPEFINRFDAVVVFKPLTKENLLLICQLMLQKLAQSLQEKGITLEITAELKEEIVKLGYSLQFGAREMRRVIQDNVENLLTEAILSDKLKRGKKVRVKVQPFSLEIE